MSWNPQGLLLRPDPKIWWMSSFAGPSHPLEIEPGHVRFYVTGRDGNNVSRIGTVDMDWSGNIPQIMAHGEPVVDVGALGCFDGDGAAYPCVTVAEGKLYLYYVGWLQGYSVAMHHGIGVAIADGFDAPFKKVSRAPMLPLTDKEPLGSASCHILYDAPGQWRMYYTSFKEWRREDGKPKHYYHVRQTHSKDGIHWSPDSRVVVTHKDESEYALGKPCFTREDGQDVLYFVARGDRYRMYRAVKRGDNYVRDEGHVQIPSSDWDSDMQAYPYLWEQGGGRIMLYNGNGYGRTGLGWALWTKVGI